MLQIIYFEKTTSTTKEMIQKYKTEGDQVLYWSELSEAEKREVLPTADIFMVATFPVDQEILSQTRKLKLVQRAGIGIDTIDVLAATKRGAWVCNTPGINAVSVAEMTIGMILGLYRKLAFMDQKTKEGQWLMWDYRPDMYEMRGKTHGIFGMGNVGKEVAQRSKAFGTKLLYSDVRRLPMDQEEEFGLQWATFEELLRESDILSVHVPLVEGTRDLIGEKELSKMKPRAILINVARGQIIDEHAVAKSLQEGRLLGAGFDTFAEEPITLDNPLRGCENALLTPHIAGGTRDVLEASIRESFQNIERVRAGEKPFYRINEI